jgi:hypothetical protein
MMKIMTDLNFVESISYLDWHGGLRPTPTASTISKLFTVNIQPLRLWTGEGVRPFAALIRHSIVPCNKPI